MKKMKIKIIISQLMLTSILLMYLFCFLFLKTELKLWDCIVPILICIILPFVFIRYEIIVMKKYCSQIDDLNHELKIATEENRIQEIDLSGAQDVLEQLRIRTKGVIRQVETAVDSKNTAKINELRSHLYALQSQMNSHFWHNILGIISLETQMRKDKKTTQICNTLSKMLSYSSSMGEGFSSLEEELQHAVNYMSLMKVRYEDFLEYSIVLPESMKKICVPKFIVQPMCENAINHAFNNMQPVWKININCYTKEDKWFINISDNGYGVENDALHKFNKMKTSITIDNFMEQMESLSIGGLSFPNVYIRLLLSYQDNMTFDIANTNKGSVVILGGLIREDKNITNSVVGDVEQ